MAQQQIRKQKHRRPAADYEPAGQVHAAHLRESCRDDEVSAVVARCNRELGEDEAIAG